MLYTALFSIILIVIYNIIILKLAVRINICIDFTLSTPEVIKRISLELRSNLSRINIFLIYYLFLETIIIIILACNF